MADQRITDYATLTGAATASGDLIEILDVSDPSMAATGTNKKITRDQLASALATAQTFGVAGPAQYVDYANGNDTNNGFSWTTAKKTIAAALTWITSFGDTFAEGDIYLAANVAHVVTTELDFPQGISIHGTTHPNVFGNGSPGYNGGTQILWGGADSGYVIKTNNFNITGGSYAAGATMENFSIVIPGSYNTVIALGIANAQNMAAFRNLAVVGGKTIGFDLWTDDGAGGPSTVATPGFIWMDRCWVYRGGTRPFWFNGGVEQILLSQCGVDANALTLAGYTVGNTPVANHGTGLSLCLVSCKFESEGATAGGSGDAPFVEVQTGSMDCDLTMIGCYEQSDVTGTLTSAAVLYSATPSQPDDAVCGVPVHIVGLMSQSRLTLLSAPNAIGGAITVKTETANSGGTRTRWSWDQANRAAQARHRQMNNQTGTTYAPALPDDGKMITLSNASAITLTIPANSSVPFPIGTEIQLMQLGAGQVTVAITTDTLRAAGSKIKTAAQYSVARLVKIAATTWVLTGDTST